MSSMLTNNFLQNIKASSIVLTLIICLFALTLFTNISTAGERLYNGASSTYVNPVARRVYHADIDKDGNMDLIIQQMTSQVGIRMGNGDGTYSFGPTLNVGSFL